MNGYGLVRADALRIPLADVSVDLIVTSPPYFALRSYQDDGEHYDGQIGSEPTPADFLAALWAVTDELWRVLKPTGSLFVDLGDKYAGSGGHNNSNLGVSASEASGSTLQGGKQFSHRPVAQDAPRSTRRNAPDRYNQATDVAAKSLMGLPWRYALGLTCPDPYRNDGVADPPQWTLRAEVVWHKLNGLPESVTDRVRRSHEQWFHLTKQGRYYAAVDEIREEHAQSSIASAPFRAKGSFHDHSDDEKRGQRIGSNAALNPLGKLPGSVWSIPSEPLVVPDHLGVDHFAAFPQEWPRRIILGWSPPGICVKCGEGRRPVVDARLRDSKPDNAADYRRAANGPNGGPRSKVHASTEATITGYRCACDVTLAPTRPAVVLDPFVGTGTVPMVARALGRYGVGLDLSRDYLRLARWRITSPSARKTIARTNRERQGALW